MKWRCGCAYDGSGFAGWQSQEGQESVQSILEVALEEVFKQPIPIVGSGRTDAGVHALEQVFHVDATWEHGERSLLKALESKLPRSIQVLYALPETDAFHARFSAKSKRYAYRLFLGSADPFAWPYCWSVTQRLDALAMKQAMDCLIGEHDFAAFAANRGQEYETTVRNMKAVSMREQGQVLELVFEADGFMYKMARSLAGALVNVGLGKLGASEFAALLQSAERSPLVYAAPPRGLFLEKVFY